MMNPFGFARAVPKFNEVINVLLKEGSEIFSYSNRLDLLEMRQRIKYISYWINSISNYYNA